jgi:hypothetical protein
MDAYARDYYERKAEDQCFMSRACRGRYSAIRDGSIGARKGAKATYTAPGRIRLKAQETFMSCHVSPETPGSIHEGGELGYSLTHAYGAAFDNPDLIVACIIGDGEAETGALATSWHSNKFLNPARDGAVLPILHLNGFKIANPNGPGGVGVGQTGDGIFTAPGPANIPSAGAFSDTIASATTQVEPVKVVEAEAPMAEATATKPTTKNGKKS